MSPRWLQPAVWSVTAVVLACAMVGHCVIWMTYIADESVVLEDFLMEDMELQLFPLNSSEHAATPASTVPQTELADSEIVNHGPKFATFGSDSMPPYQRAHKLEYWHHHADNSDYAVEGEMRLYDLRAPSQLVVMYLVYFVPMLVVGIAGWVSQHWSSTTPRVWLSNSWLVAVLSRSVRPAAFFEHCFSGLSFAELLFGLLFFAPKVVHLTWFVGAARAQWRVATDSSFMLTSITETQFWVERLGMWFSVDFQIMAPFLLAFAAQDSLVHQYLGLSFATTRKWHRWLGSWVLLDVLMHGVLYQALLLSDGSSLWGRLHRRIAYHHGVSVLAGTAAWVAAIVILAVLLPLALAAVKRSGWQWVWERVHVAAAAAVVVLGVVHSRKVWGALAPGAVLYGIALAHRCLQASRTATATASLSAASKILSVVVPLEEGGRYPDGGHVWLAMPTVRGTVSHLFRVAASASEPAWANSMLLQCKSTDPWAHELVEGLQVGKFQMVSVRMHDPVGGCEMSRAELQTTRKLLVFSGGFGVAAVLPMLQRLARHRARRQSDAGDVPQIKVFHSARSMDELILIAPLLDYPSIFDVHLHYTGPPQDLRAPPHLHTLPTPFPLPHNDPVASKTLLRSNSHSRSIGHSHTAAPARAPRPRSSQMTHATTTSTTPESSYLVQPTYESAPPAPASLLGSHAESAANWTSSQNVGRSLTSLASAPATLQTAPELPPQRCSKAAPAHRGLRVAAASVPSERSSSEAGPVGEATVGEATERRTGVAARGEHALNTQMQEFVAAERRLRGMHGKWASLFVWVGTWILSFGILLLGELWYNSSAAAQAGALGGAARDDRRFKMAAYNVLSLVLAVPTVPLLLLLLSHAPLLCRSPPPAPSAPPPHKTHGRGRGVRFGASDSSGHRSWWSRSSSSGTVLPVTAPHHPLVCGPDGLPVSIMRGVPAQKLLPGILSLSDAHAPTRLSSAHHQPSSKASSALFNSMHSCEPLGQYTYSFADGDGAPKGFQSFKHSAASSQVIVMHQRTVQSTHTTSQEASIRSMSQQIQQIQQIQQQQQLATMPVSVGPSAAVQADHSSSLWDTDFTSRMLSGDVYAMGSSMQPSGTASESSFSGSFSRVFSPPRHTYSAWLHGLCAIDFFAMLESSHPEDSRAAWLESSVGVARDFATQHTADEDALQGTTDASETLAPAATKPPSELHQDPSASTSVPRGTHRASSGRPPTGRPPSHQAPGRSPPVSYGGYSVGSWVTKAQGRRAIVSNPLPATGSASTGLAESALTAQAAKLATAPPAPAHDSTTRTSNATTHCSTTTTTGVDAVSTWSRGSGDRKPSKSGGDAQVSPMPLQQTCSERNTSDPVHAEIMTQHTRTHHRGGVPGMSQTPLETMQSDELQGMHAYHASCKLAPARADASLDDSFGCENASAAVLLRGEQPPSSQSSEQVLPSTQHASEARSRQASHQTPLDASTASGRGATLEAFCSRATRALEPRPTSSPRDLHGGLQSFAIGSLQDPKATSSPSEGSLTEDALDATPQSGLLQQASIAGRTPSFAPWMSGAAAATKTMRGSHPLAVDARDNRSSSVSFSTSGQLPSESLVQPFAVPGAAAGELSHAGSPPKSEAAQILQTVQTATGTVTRMHARAPKTWPQITDYEAPQQERGVPGMQATRSMHVDQWEPREGRTAHSDSAQTDSDMHGSDEEETFLPGWPQQTRGHLPSGPQFIDDETDGPVAAPYATHTPASEEAEAKSASQNSEASPLESSSGSDAVRGPSPSQGAAGSLSGQLWRDHDDVACRTLPHSQSRSTADSPHPITRALPPHGAESSTVSSAATDSLSAAQPRTHSRSLLDRSSETLSACLNPIGHASTGSVSTGVAGTLPGGATRASSITHALRVHPPPASPQSVGSNTGAGDCSVSLALSPDVRALPQYPGGAGSQALGRNAATAPPAQDSSGSADTATQSSITHALAHVSSSLAAGESGTVSLQLPNHFTHSSGSASLPLGAAGRLPMQRPRRNSSGTQSSNTDALHAVSPSQQPPADVSASVSLAISSGMMHDESAGSQSSAVARLLRPQDSPSVHAPHTLQGPEPASVQEVEELADQHRAGKAQDEHHDIPHMQPDCCALRAESSEANDGGAVSLALDSMLSPERTSTGGASAGQTPYPGPIQYLTSEKESPGRPGVGRRPLRLQSQTYRGSPGPVSESIDRRELQSAPAHSLLHGALRARPRVPIARAGPIGEGLEAEQPAPSSEGSGVVSNSAHTLINMVPSPANTVDHASQHAFTSLSSSPLAQGVSVAMQSSNGSKRSTASVPMNSSASVPMNSSGCSMVTQQHVQHAPPLEAQEMSVGALGHWVWADSSPARSSQHEASAPVSASRGEGPSSSAYMASEDSNSESSGNDVRNVDSSGLEQTSEAPSIMSLTLPPTPTRTQVSAALSPPNAPSCSPQLSLQFSSAFATGPTPRAIGADHSPGHMHALHAAGSQSTALQPLSPRRRPVNPATAASMHPTPVWDPSGPPGAPPVAHGGSYSVSTYTTQTDRDHTADIAADSASHEIAPLPPPHLSYEGSSPLAAAPESWASATRALGTEAGSSTWQMPSGPASFETRESAPATVALPSSSGGSDTLSALDRAVAQRLRAVYGAPGDSEPSFEAPPLTPGGPHAAELQTAPFWTAPEPPLACEDPAVPFQQALEAAIGASGSKHTHQVHAASVEGARDAQAETKRSSGSPSHYDSVMGVLHTEASSAHTAGHHSSPGATIVEAPPGEPAGNTDEKPAERNAPMQLLPAPLDALESGFSTEKSSIHHPVDQLHAKEKEQAKKEARRKARLLQARAASGGDGELASLGLSRQESSTTDAGYSGPNPSACVGRLPTSGRSRSHIYTSTVLTSPLVTDSVESVGLAAALDLDEGIGGDQQPAPEAVVQQQKSDHGSLPPARPTNTPQPHTARGGQQTVTPGGVVMVRDFGSHDGGDDRVGGGVPGRVAEPRTASRLNTEVARGSSMHSKGCNEGSQDQRVYDDASGAHGGRWPQVLVDCSSPDRVFIRSTKPGSEPVEVHVGRPDVAATVSAAFEGGDPQEAVNVWAAGPASLNLAVQVATSALPLRTNVHVLTASYAV